MTVDGGRFRRPGRRRSRNHLWPVVELMLRLVVQLLLRRLLAVPDAGRGHRRQRVRVGSGSAADALVQRSRRLPVTVVHPVVFGPTVDRVRPLVRTGRRRSAGRVSMSVRAPSISIEIIENNIYY